MAYQVSVQQAEPQPMLAAQGRATMATLPATIMALLAPCWDYIKATKIENPGYNVVLYHDEDGKTLLTPDTEVPLDAGIQLTAPLETPPAGSGLILSATPGGTVATVTHHGPYDGIPAAHSAIRDWCAANSRTLAGPCWEVYGHWSDDPAQLRTDIFYLLK